MDRRVRPLAAAAAAALACACASRPSSIEAADSPKQLLADTAAVCTAMASGDPYDWRSAEVGGATWGMLIERARNLDPKATCDAAKLIDRRWRETLTCTAGQAAELASHGRCRLR